MTSGSPSTVGQSVTFTATVSGSNLAGTVAFTDGGIRSPAAGPWHSTVPTRRPAPRRPSRSAPVRPSPPPTATIPTTRQLRHSEPNGQRSHYHHRPRVLAKPLDCRPERHLHRHGHGGSSPTGTVAFSGGGITGCGSQTLNGSGVATCTTSALCGWEPIRPSPPSTAAMPTTRPVPAR